MGGGRDKTEARIAPYFAYRNAKKVPTLLNVRRNTLDPDDEPITIKVQKATPQSSMKDVSQAEKQPLLSMGSSPSPQSPDGAGGKQESPV